ncbi:hypothetical protein [Sporolactobacillus nakayamae]|nr:hypothetical protein [Sporolactobacillus nakayamae]SFG75440.1 hypothetical protein SAMN02982927_02667 [Sporolactobacillus nakayamae]
MKILNLEDYIHLFGERDTHRSLSSFCCHEDDDVQAYIRERAFDDELAHRARTKLFIDERHQKIAGFFTILFKNNIRFSKSINEEIIDQITGDRESHYFRAILLAQLAKNDFYEKCPKEIFCGNDIIDAAKISAKNIFDSCGLNHFCLEYKSRKEWLRKFYMRHGFSDVQTKENGLTLSYLRITNE